jgi:precorrin-6B methylase 2
MKKEKKKQSTLQLILKVLPAVINTANLVIALVLALQRRKAITAAIDDNGLRENNKDVLVFGGDKGPTALYVGKNGATREEAARRWTETMTDAAELSGRALRLPEDELGSVLASVMCGYEKGARYNDGLREEHRLRCEGYEQRLDAAEERRVRETEALRAADLKGHETVLDAYCGAGTISLALAKQAKRVIGVELNAKAIEDAKKNAAKNGLSDKTQFIAGDAPQEALRLFEKGLRPDVMVVDPPRKGVEARLLEAMVKCRPERIVYVSCNPSTLARDLKILTQSGEYRVEYVQPVDMFAHTEHVENVCLLTRN